MDISKENVKREDFRKILFDLAKGQEVLQEASDRVAMYTRLEALYYPSKGEKCFRHFYSDIFMVLTQIENQTSLGDINILGENLRLIRKGYKPQNLDEDGTLIDIEDSIKKLYDHVSLDIARISYLTAGQKENIGELAINEIKAQVSRLDKEIDFANEKQAKVEEEISKQQKEYISILGIFASIVLTFNAGIAYSGSVLDSMNSASVYRVVLVSLLVGLVLVNVLFTLFYYIDRLIVGEHGVKIIRTTNFILLSMILCTILAWFFGLVEWRDNRMDNSIPTENVSVQVSSETQFIDESVEIIE